MGGVNPGTNEKEGDYSRGALFGMCPFCFITNARSPYLRLAADV